MNLIQGRTKAFELLDTIENTQVSDIKDTIKKLRLSIKSIPDNKDELETYYYLTGFAIGKAYAIIEDMNNLKAIFDSIVENK